MERRLEHHPRHRNSAPRASASKGGELIAALTGGLDNGNVSLARFFVETLSSGVIRLGAAEARHALAARRLSVADTVVLFDGRGGEGTGRITSASKDAVQVEVSSVLHRQRPRPQLTLAVATPKGPRQDVLVEKCAELGVAGIWPIVTERGVATVTAHRLGKWRRTTIEAAKQSGQAWLPELRPPASLGDLLAEPGRFDHAVVATVVPMDGLDLERGQMEIAEGRGSLSGEESSASQPFLRRVSSRLASGQHMPYLLHLSYLMDAWREADTILAFVGPEGGWTDHELIALLDAGVKPVRLGPNTLRIETAAIALAAAVHALHQQSR